MTRLLPLFIGLLLLANCSSSQPTDKRPLITGNITTDVNNLLPEGKVQVDVMDGIKQNPRQEELTKKFQTGIQQNYEWFVDYMKTVPEGEPMPYHKNLGLAESEYKELQGYMNDIELVSSGKSDITIKKNKNIIEFTASGKLQLLEAVKIDLSKNIVVVGEYELPFSDTANITTDTNGLKSKWKGYTWKLEEPKDMDLNALKNLQSLKAKQYKFTIGRLDKTGKTFISIKGQEIENGAKQVSFELPLIF